MEKQRIYNSRQIQAACVIGSPIVGGLLIAHNFRKFGNNQKSLLWILIGLAWTALLIVLGSLLPERLASSTGMVVTIINGALIYQIVNKIQGEKIKNHFENNGNKGSNWTIAGMVICVVAVFAVPMIMLNNLTQIDNYNRQAFDKNGIYYNQEMNIDEVNKLGGILSRVDYFNSESAGEVIFLSNDSTYELKLILDKTATADSTFNVYIKELFNHVNSYDFRKPITYMTTDVYLNNEKIIELDKNAEYASFAEMEVFSENPNFILLYHKDFNKVERRKFQNLILEMSNIFPPQNRFDFFIDFENGMYSLRLFIPKQNWNQPRLISEAKFLNNRLNNYGFEKPFKLILVDNTTLDYDEKQIE